MLTFFEDEVLVCSVFESIAESVTELKVSNLRILGILVTSICPDLASLAVEPLLEN